MSLNLITSRPVGTIRELRSKSPTTHYEFDLPEGTGVRIGSGDDAVDLRIRRILSDYVHISLELPHDVEVVEDEEGLAVFASFGEEE